MGQSSSRSRERRNSNNPGRSPAPSTTTTTTNSTYEGSNQTNPNRSSASASNAASTLPTGAVEVIYQSHLRTPRQSTWTAIANPDARFQNTTEPAMRSMEQATSNVGEVEGATGAGDATQSASSPSNRTTRERNNGSHGPPVQSESMTHFRLEKAVVMKSYVNVQKDSVRFVPDRRNPQRYLLSFNFDALCSCCITIYYFAKEGSDCVFTPLYPELYPPKRLKLDGGFGQRFCESSGEGVDFRCFKPDDLVKTFLPQDIFALVIRAETEKSSELAQISLGVLEKGRGRQLQARVTKQMLWVLGARYELQEIYGYPGTIDEESRETECAVCLTNLVDTLSLPCRHMCLCLDCANHVWSRFKKCPLCRQPIQKLFTFPLPRDW